MIRKFLICGKQLFLSNGRVEDQTDKVVSLELLLPLDLFWQLQRDFKKIEYLLATNEDPMIVQDVQRTILSRVRPYAVSEKDRAYLNEILKNAT